MQELTRSKSLSTLLLEETERNPRNGRSLFGLFNSLEAQGKNFAAQLVKTEFDSAWKNADTQLSAE